MKRAFRLFSVLLLLPVMLLASCKRERDGEDTVLMVARITSLGERIEVEVLESEYTSGPHWVLTPDETVFENSGGGRISRDELAVGDTVEIYYNGQVMLSYPPQIVAHKIVRR